MQYIHKWMIVLGTLAFGALGAALYWPEYSGVIGPCVMLVSYLCAIVAVEMGERRFKRLQAAHDREMAGCFEQ